VQGVVDIFMVSKRFGHGDLKTMSRYAHLALDQRDLREAAVLSRPGMKEQVGATGAPNSKRRWVAR
jgi:hypothetical protein